MAKGTRRGFMIPDELYAEARQAAHQESLQEGETVTLAEFTRRALADRIKRIAPKQDKA